MRSIHTCLERWVPDLWKSTQPIVQFSTGVPATDDMRDNTFDIQVRGTTDRDNFLAALTSEDSKGVYYGKIEKKQVKLF